ncbi:hypothetical protein GCM10008904_32980 [Paraclostridium ghonii]|uniref:Cardiolipin synthase N-terminal domain-containing protein n=1 Tax=Paraclostridium ghonii TaxID=29358 RepID=A0ABU0N4E2_9FIRM|nr:hypothetical protein [Paeniclostridium ghonii]MDQ0558027.1 hypothetical protein [Paeniclostridium ghonii]
MIVWIIIFLGFMIVSLIFLGLWTYRDAKNRGLNAKLWTLIVLLVPNLIGLLIYFLVGRKSTMIKCLNCCNDTPKSSKYCMNCGDLISINKVDNTKSTSKFMVGFVVCFIVSIMAWMGIFITLIKSEGLEVKEGVSIFLLETNSKNDWEISYYKSSDKFTKNIDLKESSPSNLNVNASCEQGNLYLTLEQGDKKEVFDISNTEGAKNIDLRKFNDGKLDLKLIDENCRKVKFKANWE